MNRCNSVGRLQAATWWRGEDSNLRRLSQQIYSLPPLTAREPLRDLQTVNFLSFDQDRQDFSAKFPSHWPISPRPGARRGIRTPDLLILTHYCFRSRRGSAFGVWTFSSPCRDHWVLGLGGWCKVSTLAPPLFSPASQYCGASTGLPFCLTSRQRGFPRFSHLH